MQVFQIPACYSNWTTNKERSVERNERIERSICQAISQSNGYFQKRHREDLKADVGRGDLSPCPITISPNWMKTMGGAYNLLQSLHYKEQKRSL
jgi:hypothetical protein